MGDTLDAAELDELERLAVAARDARFPTAQADGEFQDAADPATVLALVAQARRAEAAEARVMELESALAPQPDADTRPPRPTPTADWYSYCSAHQDYDPACDVCQGGEWLWPAPQPDAGGEG